MKPRAVMIILSTGLIGLSSLAGCGKASEATTGRNADISSETVETEKKDPAPKEEAGGEPAAESEAEPDYEACYAPVLDEVLAVVTDGYDYDREYRYVSNGLMEKCMYPGDEDLTEAVGFLLEDMSGDGIPELLIGCDETYGDGAPQSTIFNLFTLKEEEPFSVFEGWARSSYRPMEDAHFYYCGSGGAAITLFGENHLSEDGTEILWDDFYFSDEKDGGEVGLYHNTSGIFDAKESEEVQMSQDTFFKKMDDYEAKCIRISWTPIGSYAGKSGSTESTGGKSTSVSPEKELAGDWLFPNGATLAVSADGTYELLDDTDAWRFSGNWETDDGTGNVTVTLYSEVGDTGNRQVAQGTLYEDAAGYLALDLTFEPYLTEFTDGSVTLRKK